MFSKSAVLVAGVLLLASMAVASEKAKSDKVPARTSATAVVSFCDASCGTSFSVTKARDIKVNTDWSGLPAGEHVQKTVLYLPDGSVYQTFETKFQSPKKTAKVTNVVPVAGSWIHQRGLKGAWTVSVYLDSKLARNAPLLFTK